ncbi:27148_t:CDS:2, partial [Racocetra persica]
QFYEELIAGKIVSEVRLDNEDCLQPVKAEFSSNITGPFNVVSMECNMIEAIEAWGTEYNIIKQIIRENKGRWGKDTAMTTGKEFVKDLAAAL